jgi:carbon monoxide dehydrogenase subunit G
VRRVERSVEVAAPPERVFAYLASIDNLAEWQSGMRSVRQTSPGSVGVGTTAFTVRELAGQRIEAPLRITAYDPPRRLALTSEAHGVRLEAELEIAALEPGGSRVTYRAEITASGFMRFMEPMIASTAEADLADSLRRIRERLEEPDRAADSREP